MGAPSWRCGVCTYLNDDGASPSSHLCEMCNTDHLAMVPHMPFLYPHRTTFSERTLRSLTGINGQTFSLSTCTIPRLFAGVLSGAVTGIFAVVGAFTGAVTGALAGRATDSGLLRGAGLGAVAGAVLSVELLDASRAYWYSDPSPSVAEFIEGFLNERFAEDHAITSMPSTSHWQVNFAEMSYEDLYEMFGPEGGVMKGVSEACISELPWFLVSENNVKDSHGEKISCAICLQELLQGEMARRLPLCQHVFHLFCVDKWLVRHRSCPICRKVIDAKV